MLRHDSLLVGVEGVRDDVHSSRSGDPGVTVGDAQADGRHSAELDRSDPGAWDTSENWARPDRWAGPDAWTGPIALQDPPTATTGPRLIHPAVTRLPRPRPGGEHAPGPMRVSDAALAAAASTSSTAFAAIYRRYGDALHDFCLGMLRDPDAAADCVQDVFCTAATRLGQLREHDKLRPWLYAIARHEALARLRGRRREQVVDELPDHPSPDHSADTLVARRELADLVARAAGGLADRDRTLLELHYRHGLDGPELADALGVSATNANTLVSRLRTTVERCLGALLVARHEREACAELDDLLENWDGTMTVLLRKRVNRHIERCSRCTEARRRLLSPATLLASAPVAVPAPGWLGDSVARQTAPMLHDTSGTTATGTSWWPAGLTGGTHTSATVLAPIVAAVVAASAVAVAMLTGGGTTLNSDIAPRALVPPTSAAPSSQSATPSAATSSPTPSTSAGPVPSSRLVPGAPGAPSGGARPSARPGQPAAPIPTAPLGPFRRTPVAPAPVEPTRVAPPETRPTTGSGCVACSATTAPPETP